MWFLILFYFLGVNSLERKLTHFKNPGCEQCNFTIYYTKAEGLNDTLHYIWDFKNQPSIFLALTPPDSNITFNWTSYLKDDNRSFFFSNEPSYAFTLIINKIIEFDDPNDIGFLTDTSLNVSYNMRHFIWQDKATSGSELFTLEMTGSKYMGKSALSGLVSIQLTAFGVEKHDEELPRLLHSANSTQCKITLEKMSSDSGFHNSRYAIEFILVSSDGRSSSSEILTRKSLDDENSPGVFSIVDLMTPMAKDHLSKGAFLQWRPVAYTSKVPNIGNSTELIVYDLTNVSDPEVSLRDTLAYKYYGSQLNSNLVQQTIVSLGSKEDGFYRKTNYSSWTFLINYGSPEDEKFSLLVIMVMAIGLGLPAILILLGGIYMCARRLSRNKDELSLGR